MALLVAVSVVAGGVALGATPGPDAGPGNAPTETPDEADEGDDSDDRSDDAPDVDNFTDTSPLRGTQTDPPSLAGKLRVESQHADNTTVELVRNSSTDFTLDVNVTGNATNVTFYLQETAFAASQNVSNVSATLDGEPLALGTTEARGSTWIAFEIDHFSTRTVSFEADGRDDTGDGRDAAGPPALPGASNAPIDPDGDGVYEDVNGDGDVTPGDATVLFEAVFGNDAAVTDNPDAFDFNGDGSATAGDATVLFEEIFG